MAFAQIETTADTTQTGNATNWGAQNMPASIAAGDLLIAVVAIDGASIGCSFTGGTGGWTNIMSGVGASDGTVTMAIGYREANGTDDALSLTMSESQQGACRVWRISGAESPSVGNPPQLGAITTGASATPAVGLTTPSGGAADFLWFALCAHDRNQTFTSAPTGYQAADGSLSSGGANGAQISYGDKEANAASDDPDNFTYASSDGFVTRGLVIHPEVPLHRQRAFRFVNDNGTESASTFAAALNTDFTGDRDTTFRCRLGIDNLAATDTSRVYRIQKSIDGGAFSDLKADGSDVRLVLSTHFADGDVTTERLAGAETFVAGAMIEGSGTDFADSTGVVLATNEETEIEFAFDCTGLKGAQTVDFRAVISTATLLFEYVQTPRFTVDSNAVQTVLRVTFATPTNNLFTGADKQRFRAYVRKDSLNSGTGTPNVDFFLYESGTQKQVLTANTNVTSDSGEVIEATWDATNLAAVSGANVELRIVGDTGGTGINVRGIEFGAVEWCVEHEVVAEGEHTASGSPSITNITAAGTGSVSAAPPSITDVNTTESWEDGDTGLVITGTKFI